MTPWVCMYDADVVRDEPEKEPLLTFSLPFNAGKLEAMGRAALIFYSPVYL